MKILICEALGHSYGEHRALDACSLALEQGKLHVLLGPSGCGKSTLLEVIAGLQPCTQGRIILRGEEISQQPPQQLAQQVDNHQADHQRGCCGEDHADGELTERVGKGRS
ncbi:MAG: ATP-binding cassette domain-containing protein, partial [Merdibacter sp.]|nr:ATP-binding cassette domain-containing protein [Merdibacter sp.]